MRSVQNSVNRFGSVYNYTFCSSKPVFAEKVKWPTVLNVTMNPSFLVQQGEILYLVKDCKLVRYYLDV